MAFSCLIDKNDGEMATIAVLEPLTLSHGTYKVPEDRFGRHAPGKAAYTSKKFCALRRKGCAGSRTIWQAETVINIDDLNLSGL